MDFEIPEEHRMLKDLVARFVREDLVPLENALLKREADGLTVHFRVTDTAQAIPVVYKGIIPFLVIYLIALVLITYIPAISLSGMRFLLGLN